MMKTKLTELTPFLDSQGRLTALPAKHKKKLLALWYLAQKIDSGRQYTEAEINDLLDTWAVFHDHATLRRELYNKHLLNRTADCRLYWKEANIPALVDFIGGQHLGGLTMLHVTDITDTAPVYGYCAQLAAPYFFPAAFEQWKASFLRDVDGNGRPLFRELYGKAAYDGDQMVGFVQYGFTAFGFDEQGEISGDISYPVIRFLYFDKGREDAGSLLLEAALEEFQNSGRVYAFFHYFGMSCYARHGKLFEKFPWVEALLRRNFFVTEHENVYYSSEIPEDSGSDVTLAAQEQTAGGHRSFAFVLDGNQIGGCEVHYVSEKTAYLRWIYINGEIQNRGVGSKCMAALKGHLFNWGYTRLDTDTAVNNLRAQHFYEKNGFRREGVTRSFFRDGECL